MSYRAENCPACGSSSLEFRPAIVAPFVAARVYGRRADLCRVARCRTCDLQFFEQRYDEAEAGRLYSDYRSGEYYKQRHHWEPWYTRAVNDGLGDAAEFVVRRSAYRGAIAAADGANIGTVLDYGGDRGQMMLGGPGQEYFVFDISGVAPEAGVTRIPDTDALQGRSFDLVLLCEVLEHVSEPLRYLRDVARHVRPGGLLYVTVPNREFQFGDIPAGAWYRGWLGAILFSRWLTLAADFWSTAIRSKIKRVPPLGFVKQHEHINSYDVRPLTHMLSLAGLRVLTCEPYCNDKGLLALCCRVADAT